MTELFIAVATLSLSVVAFLHAVRYLKKMVGKDQAWPRVKPSKNMPVTLPVFLAALLIALGLSIAFYQISQVKAQSSGLSVEILAVTVSQSVSGISDRKDDPTNSSEVLAKYLQ